MVRVTAPAFGGGGHDGFFNRQRGFAGAKAGAIGDAEDVSINGAGLNAEGFVEDNIGGFAPHARQRFERFEAFRDQATVCFDEDLAERYDVFGLVVEQPDGLDVLTHPCFTERQHFFRGVGFGEQAFCSFVDANIGALGRQDDGDKQRVGIDVFKLGARSWVKAGQRLIKRLDFGFRHFSGHFSGVALWLVHVQRQAARVTIWILCST